MRLPDLRVSDLMSTAVISVKASDTLDHARTTMEVADIRHLPVVDDKFHVVGVLSNRDLLRAASRRGAAKLRVGTLMTREVVTVHPRTGAAEAAARMLERKIGSLPVVGEDEILVGVVTETDFLRLAERALRAGPEERLAWR
jgi:CBS domain-containing protein